MPHTIVIPPAKVLIVDDQDSKRLALAAALEPLGQEIVMVASGREALRQLLNDDFAVILLDVRMPDMDGFETASLIRARKQSEKTPIIFVTAHDRAEADMVGGYSIGAVDFIYSPIQPEILRAKVQVFVDLHRHALTVQAHERRLRELEARQAQHELSKLSGAIEQSADPVVITDRDGRIEYVNAAFTAVSGFTREEAAGQPLDLLESGEHPEGFRAQLWATIRRGEVYRGEFVNRRKDGTLYHEERTITPIQSDAGEITHFVSTGKDVTERKRMEAELQALNAHLEDRVRERTAQLRDMNEELEAYAYSISHDLRTPLRHILSFADLLERRTVNDLPADAKKHLKYIQTGALRMSHLIDGLLDFARTGRHDLKPQALNLNTLVQEVIADLERDPDAPPTRWNVDPLPTVQADLVSLRQVVTNLLTNAVKYSRDAQGGPQIRIWADDCGGDHRIHVQDNGIGFNMEYRHKLFNVFQRLHTHDEFDGHGVGLAHVKRIIVRHGGQVTAQGEEGCGATFSFTLPQQRLLTEEELDHVTAEGDPAQPEPAHAEP